MRVRNLYQVREFIGSSYSKQLGRKLRERPSAMRIVKRLRKDGRAVFAAPVGVTV